MTRKYFTGYTYEEALNKVNIKGITDAKHFDKLGVWKITVINCK